MEFRESVIAKAMAYGNFPAQKKMIEKYKALLRAKGGAGEEYKWEISGKDHWRLESPDFPSRVKKIPFKNLVYQFAVSVLNQLADRYPEELIGKFITKDQELLDLYESVKPRDPNMTGYGTLTAIELYTKWLYFV